MGIVGVLVMMTVVAGPPQRAFLHGQATGPRKDELKGPAGLEGTVRKISVITGGNAEHAQRVNGQAERKCFPTHARPKRCEAHNVNAQERRR